MPIIVVFGGLSIAVLVWAWRYWALRTGRTIAVVASGLIAAIALSLVLPTPYGLVAGSLAVGVAAYIVMIGSAFLRAVSDADYSYGDELRTAEEEASRVLSRVGTKIDTEEAGRTLAAIIDRLVSLPDHSRWSSVRDLKVEELRLGQAILRGASTHPEADVARQRDLRRRAHDEYFAVRRAVAKFW
jgi:hypothetical protein